MLPALLLALAQSTDVPQAPPAATQQDPAPGPAQGPATAPELLNGIYIAVNEEPVTLGEFYRELSRTGKSVTNEEERRRVLQESHADLVKSKLMSQAGRDLGFDPARVKSLVDDDLEGFIEDAGSVSGFGSVLKQSNLDAETFREQREEFYYRELWQRSIDGRDPGVSGRPYVDRFISPSRLYYQFRRQPIEQLFPARIRVQAIFVSAAQAGSGRRAQELAAALRERALGGEDFGELAKTYSADGSARQGGLLPMTELEGAKRGFPSLAEFFDTATVGAISEVSPHRVENELVGFLVMRVDGLERLASNEFADLGVQKLLRDRDLKAQTEFRRDLRLAELYRAAYVWPPEARPNGGSKSGAAPAATPGSTPPAAATPDAAGTSGR
ncbi:MAG: peptidylprolyl isomerase [Planctomycetota bacterium]|nr:peptidylprolyl isomerase [Planctomycetota bacterium]